MNSNIFKKPSQKEKKIGERSMHLRCIKTNLKKCLYKSFRLVCVSNLAVLCKMKFQLNWTNSLLKLWIYPQSVKTCTCINWNDTHKVTLWKTTKEHVLFNCTNYSPPFCSFSVWVECACEQIEMKITQS